MMKLGRTLAMAAALLAPAAGTAAAADFGDAAYGMPVPFVQGEIADDAIVPVGQRYRVVRPAPIYQAPAYENGYGNGQDYTYGQYPDPQGAYAQEPLPPRPNGRCLGPSQIENMLAAQGWRRFVNPQRGVDVVGLTASRPNGLTYRLKLDRCTGVILQANLLDQPDTRRNYGYNPDAPPPGY